MVAAVHVGHTYVIAIGPVQLPEEETNRRCLRQDSAGDGALQISSRRDGTIRRGMLGALTRGVGEALGSVAYPGPG